MRHPIKYFHLVFLVLFLTFNIGTDVVFTQSEVKAESSNSHKSEADRLQKKGTELIDTGKTEAALQTLQQALIFYRKANNPQGEGQVLKGIGNAYYDLRDYRQSISYQQQALKIAEEINDKDLESRVLGNLGNAYRGLEDFKQAISYYQKSLDIAKKLKNYQLQANTLENLGYVYFPISIDKGIDFLEQSLVALRQVNPIPEKKLSQQQQETDILISLGRNYFLLTQYKAVQDKTQANTIFDKSIQSYETALKITTLTKNFAQEGEVLLGLGRTYNSRSQYQQASESFQKSAEAFLKDKNSRKRAGEAFASLGEVYKNSGKPKEALSYLEKALGIAKTEPANSSEDKLKQGNQQGLILVNITDIYAESGKYQEALEVSKDSIEAFKSVLALAEKNTNSNKLITQIEVTQANLGVKNACIKISYVYALLGQPGQTDKDCSKNKNTTDDIASNPNKKPDNPLEAAQQELAFAQRLGKRELEVYALMNIGDVYEKQNQGVTPKVSNSGNRSLEYYNKAAELAKSIGNPQAQTQTLFKLAEYHKTKQNYSQALEYYQESLIFANKTQDKVITGNILTQIGAAYLNTSNYNKASISLYDAINLYESLRAGLTDKNKISIFEIQTYAYSLLQQTLIAKNEPSEALLVAERGRARAFVELLASKLSENFQVPASNKPPQIQEIKQIAKQQKATLVEYSITGDELYIWVVKPTGEMDFKKVDLKSSNISLANLVAKSRKSLGVGGRGTRITNQINKKGNNSKNFGVSISQNTNDNTNQNTNQKTSKSLRQLHQLLISPIAKLLPNNPEENVIFIPHESLFLVPFAALQDENGKYLIEKHTISTSPAIQILGLTYQQKQKPRGKDILVLGNPIMPKVGNPPEQLESLQGAEEEAKTIAKLENTMAIIGKEATETFLKQKLGNSKIVHLATHGLLEDPKDKSIPTAIALAPSNSDDGLLTPGEIVDLSISADLVVLSACDTGRGKITGDGVIGLSRSLITAGASSVVVSLWAVPDTATSELMIEFYQNLQKNPNKAMALRSAMLTTMKKHPNPIDWAGFTFMGS
jgi:CHAT domain-containing protein